MVYRTLAVAEEDNYKHSNVTHVKVNISLDPKSKHDT